MLAAAEVLAGSAIDEKFQAPPLTSDTHSLFLYVAFWFLCRAEKPQYMTLLPINLTIFRLHFIINRQITDCVVFERSGVVAVLLNFDDDEGFVRFDNVFFSRK